VIAQVSTGLVSHASWLLATGILCEVFGAQIDDIIDQIETLPI
jgi:hypothetical protein